MLKLNRKGFTLIELLAVIVVLAIVLVVTIPSVIKSVDKAREQSLQNAANSVADWMTRQSELIELEGTGITDVEVNEYFAELFPNITTDEATFDEMVTSGDVGMKEDALLKAAGIGGGTTDVSLSAWLLDNGKICVKLQGNGGGRFVANAVASSAGC